MQGETTASLLHDRRVLACQPCAMHTVVTGCEGGSLHAWDVRKADEPLASHEHAHACRVRALCVGTSIKQRASDLAATDALASASSDGSIKAWSVERVCERGTLQPLAHVNAGARFTCMCAVRFNDESTAGAKALDLDRRVSSQGASSASEGDALPAFASGNRAGGAGAKLVGSAADGNLDDVPQRAATDRAPLGKRPTGAHHEAGDKSASRSRKRGAKDTTVPINAKKSR